MTAATSSEISRATRGTKRVCQACEVRFYDLARDPIVCPSCGAQYAVPVTPVMEPGARKAPYASKRWGDRTASKRPEVVVPSEVEPIKAPHVAENASEEIEAEIEAAPEVEAAEEEDVVLEPEDDETDVAALVDHDDEPKER